MHHSRRHLTSYLTAALAATALGQADAATIVTLYGPGARTVGTDPATPVGINMFTGTINDGTTGTSYFKYLQAPSDPSESIIFTRGTDFVPDYWTRLGLYYNGLFQNGAEPGDQNYVNISFNGNDGVYEAVGQFFFDTTSTGYLVAIAQNDDNSALSIPDGKAAIDAIPEPSTVGLLALGAAGLAMLRRRKTA